MKKLFDPNPSLIWLFCLTHPDDEISICAWIRRLATQGNRVALSWTHSPPVRTNEAKAAAAHMGVSAENLYFHGGTDGNICDEISKLVPSFEAMFANVKPDRVCCGAFEQGHLDHDATNFMVNRSFKGPVLEIPFYHIYTTRLQTLNRFSDPLGQEVLSLEPHEQAFKRMIARQYPSQNIWQILFWYELGRVLTLRKMELAKTERMRLQTHFDFLNPAHPPRLAKKVVQNQQWIRWCSAIKNLDNQGLRTNV